MMNWDDARTETVQFMRSTLGSGYIREYYESFADELIEILKQVERSDAQPETAPTSTLRAQLHDATQTITITKIGDSSVYVGMTRDDAEQLVAQLQRELAE